LLDRRVDLRGAVESAVLVGIGSGWSHWRAGLRIPERLRTKGVFLQWRLLFLLITGFVSVLVLDLGHLLAFRRLWRQRTGRFAVGGTAFEQLRGLGARLAGLAFLAQGLRGGLA